MYQSLGEHRRKSWAVYTTTTTTNLNFNMEEDTEVLDWGNEDDEQQLSDLRASHRYHPDSRDDADDAVSLGGDEDDMQDFAVYQTRPHQNTEQSQTNVSSLSDSLQHHSTQSNRDDQESSPTKLSRKDPHLRRSQSLSISKIIHALPPKPVLVNPTFTRQPSTQISTLASSMVRRDRKPNGQTKSLSSSNDSNDALPSDWEIRYPRNGGSEVYYYNIVTHESTWTRPSLSGSRQSSPVKDWGNDYPQVPHSPHALVDDSPRPQIDRSASRPKKDAKRHSSPTIGDSLSYEDRHYRPGESAQLAITDGCSDRNDPRALRASSVSPRPTESRRARSTTPPRTRKDLSPPHSPAGQGMWKGSTRDASSRISPPPERSWSRARNEDSRAQSLERSSTSRGRRQRGDIEPPQYLSSSTQEQRYRDDTLRDVPTQSTLSSHTPTPRPKPRSLFSSRGGRKALISSSLGSRDVSSSFHSYHRHRSLIHSRTLTMDPFSFFRSFTQ